MVAITLIFGIITACSHERSGVIEVRSVYQGQYCPQKTAGLYFIEPAELAGVVGSGRRGGLADRWEEAEPAGTPDVKTDERLVLISLGQKSSGGYALLLTANQANVDAEVVHLPINAQQPAPGSMQTMQITSPCLIIALPATGYKAVKSDLFSNVWPIKK